MLSSKLLAMEKLDVKLPIMSLQELLKISKIILNLNHIREELNHSLI
jgi:hypothetical protein